jgi:simple sugar transport system permease protein
LTTHQKLPILGSGRIHAGLLVALVATALVWWALTRTRWGFQLRVVGGNSEAARRAGLPVGQLLLSAMFVGGALAGLGGFTHLAGAEFKLRQGFCATYGYIAFLASWLARHRPVRVALAALVLSAISVSGDSLQLDSQLPAATVNVLMALVLLAVFGWTRPKAVTT